MTEGPNEWIGLANAMTRNIKSVKEMNKYNIQRNHNCQQLYRSTMKLNYDSICTFTDSPTAMQYKRAYEIFLKAQSILWSYTKETVDDEDDCNFLQPGFHGYAEGEMCENHLFEMFPLPPHSMQWIEQYLALRPGDIQAEYFKICLIRKENPIISPRKEVSGYSEYKRLGRIITAHEKFALKLKQPQSSLTVSKKMLLKLKVDVNFMLGSHYTISNQNLRALDSFKTSYSYDESNLDSLYGVAFCQQFFNLDESVRLLLTFLEKAPTCHKRYYDGLYTLSLINITHYSDIKEAERYYALGLEAEKKQLPFLSVDCLLSKDIARLFLTNGDFVSNLK